MFTIAIVIFLIDLKKKVIFAAKMLPVAGEIKTFALFSC